MKATRSGQRRNGRTHRRREGPITFEEFVDLVSDGIKADLIDGVIYMASPDNTEANDLNTWLSHVLHGFVEMKELGKIYVSRVAYRIGAKRGPEPDIGFVPKEMEAKRRRGYIDGAPALAIEIVSPDSVERDYETKRALYEEAGVREYWILDPDERRATFLVLRGGTYRKALPVKQVFHSTALPGFRIDVRWLLTEDRPRAHEVVQQLLNE